MTLIVQELKHVTTWYVRAVRKGVTSGGSCALESCGMFAKRAAEFRVCQLFSEGRRVSNHLACTTAVVFLSSFLFLTTKPGSWARCRPTRKTPSLPPRCCGDRHALLRPSIGENLQADEGEKQCVAAGWFVVGSRFGSAVHTASPRGCSSRSQSHSLSEETAIQKGRRRGSGRSSGRRMVFDQ